MSRMRVRFDGPDPLLTGNAIEVARREPDGRWLFIIDHATGASVDCDKAQLVLSDFQEVDAGAERQSRTASRSPDTAPIVEAPPFAGLLFISGKPRTS
jgi:hypothetical protein